MSKKTSYSYVGISFIVLLFGIYFVPKIIDRVSNKDVVRDESRSEDINLNPRKRPGNLSDLSFIELNGVPKKVPEFSFTDQNGKTVTNKDYEGKVYVLEFFFTTCPSIDESADGGFEHSGNFALIDKNGFIRSRSDIQGSPIIYYNGIISEAEKVDEEGMEQQITMLKQDIAKLLKE